MDYHKIEDDIFNYFQLKNKENGFTFYDSKYITSRVRVIRSF
jgi:hypothetical protein